MRNIFALLLISLIFISCNTKPMMDQQEPFTLILASSAKPGGVMRASPSIPTNARLILLSSSPLEPSTVNSSSIYLQNSNGNKLSTDVISDGQNITISPTLHLLAFTQYTIVVTTTLQNTKGQHLSQNLVIPFTTNAQVDFAGPVLAANLPQAASNVNPYTQLFMQFNEVISPIHFDPNAFKVYSEPSYLVEVPGEVILTGSVLRFVPEATLAFETGYRMELDTASIIDLAGNPYVGNSIESIDFGVVASGSETSTVSLTDSMQPLDLGGVAYCMQSIDTTLFVGGDNGLSIFTYDPTTSLSTQAYLTADTVGHVYSIDVNTTINRLYLASSKGFVIVDITKLKYPSLISTFTPHNQYGNSVAIFGLDVVENHAYLAASTEGLISLDITNERSAVKEFTIDTEGTAFDVVRMDGTLALADYDQGTKLYGLDGTGLSVPSPQATGHDRRIIPFATTDISDNPSFDYYIASGIAGIKYWDSYNGVGDLPSNYASSYVVDLVKNRITNAKNYANVLGIGIGYVNGSFITSYQLLPYNATTIGYLYSGSQELIFAADTDGFLHMYKVP